MYALVLQSDQTTLNVHLLLSGISLLFIFLVREFTLALHSRSRMKLLLSQASKFVWYALFKQKLLQ